MKTRIQKAIADVTAAREQLKAYAGNPSLENRFLLYDALETLRQTVDQLSNEKTMVDDQAFILEHV